MSVKGVGRGEGECKRGREGRRWTVILSSSWDSGVILRNLESRCQGQLFQATVSSQILTGVFSETPGFRLSFLV